MYTHAQSTKYRYHGPVYNLITLKDPKFTQAVEVRIH